MAYDRSDDRGSRPRWYGDRYSGRFRDEEWDQSRNSDWDRGRESPRRDRDDRGFFERAGDEIASWFGDDEPDRGPHARQGHSQGSHAEGGRRPAPPQRDRERERNVDRDVERHAERDRGYRPMAGDYGRGHQEGPSREAGQWRPRTGGHQDPHFQSLRQRHLDELDRDYEEYRRENQSRFESEFSGWREQRMRKRGLLGQIREHMDVVGSDDEHVGTIERVAGDRIILSKPDSESEGAQHSLSCADIDRVEGDRVILDCAGGQARERWRDERRSRALFERDDQGEMGPHVLDRSFSGTYRD